MSRILLGAFALAAFTGTALAADYEAPLPLTVMPPAMDDPASSGYGPSPFAVSGSAYGLSGYGYYYDEPTEHRLGPPPGPRYRRAADLRRRAWR